MFKIKRKRTGPVLWQIPLHQRKNTKAKVTIQERHQNVYTTIAGRLRRSVWVITVVQLLSLNRAIRNPRLNCKKCHPLQCEECIARLEKCMQLHRHSWLKQALISAQTNYHQSPLKAAGSLCILDRSQRTTMHHWFLIMRPYHMFVNIICNLCSHASCRVIAAN